MTDVTAVPSGDPFRLNLKIHAGVVIGLGLLYALGFWHASRQNGLEGLGMILMILPLSGYLVVTTMLVLAFHRRRNAAVTTHAIGLTLSAAILVVSSLGDGPRPAPALPPTHDETCMRLSSLLVHDGHPASVDVELENRCSTTVMVETVDLVGFPPMGGNTFFGPRERARTRVAAHASSRLRLEELGSPQRRDGLAAWSFRLNLALSETTQRDPCFTTPGAPATDGCTTIPPGTIRSD